MQVLTAQQFAQRLMTSNYGEGAIRTMRPGSEGTITFNVTGLTAQEQGLARNALAEIARMTGLSFRETTGSAKITYSHEGSGANTRTTYSGTTINTATVRIAADRVEPGDSYGSYAFRTYVHETLHALGLGHPQDYDRVEEFRQSAIANDSWQMSIMSYFDQDENTWVNATKAYHLTPMLADYLALRQMYAAPAMHTGNTTYGVNSNAGGSLDAMARLGAQATFLIADHGGRDAVNFSGTGAAQRIDLTPGAVSNVMGAVGNMQIAPDTVIEDATGGTGADTIIGNAAANRLTGNAGADQLYGRAGADVLNGGDGNDRLWGEDGNDQMAGGLGNDSLYGGAGDDRLSDAGGVNLLDGGLGNDALAGGSGNDRLLGAAGSDTISGNGGNDLIEGGNGGDRLFGQNGADRIQGDAGNDILIGGAGDDTLLGGTGNDDLAAQSGRDLLDGGAGNDLLRGGTGADRFVFTGGADTVRNFDAAQDAIDLRSFAGLETWADVRGQLVQAGNHVEFRQDGHMLRIEWTQLADLGSDDFLW